MKHIIKVEYIKNYTLKIEFEDKVSKTVDFSQFFDKGPIFAPLRDPQYFQQYFVDAYTVCWPNGADIAPETLYMAC